MRFIKLLLFTIVSVTGLFGNDMSGELIDGLRVIEVSSKEKPNYRVFRGDYIVFKSKETLTVEIPEMGFKENLPKSHPYIKMKKVGKQSIKVGDKTGTIQVLDYTSPSYKEVTAKEASDLINNISPLILDVRTPGEYESGHIENSILIPVQILKGNIDKIAEYKNEPIFIYCRSGNRSTVASQILIENGFNNIYNLRHGISDWAVKGYNISK